MKTNETNRKALFALGLLLSIAYCAGSQPVTRPVEGIPNYDRVNDGLCRGAQPDALGMQSLQRLGVKTIINLRKRKEVWAPEEAQARAAGMTYTNVPMSGTWRPTNEQVAKVLSLIETLPGPVFIHCKRGADRTGTIIACYRIKHDQWSSKAALLEARQHGMSRWFFGMKKYVEEYAASMDRK
jgi:tyrosine-protein phosphatase SIW14